MRGGQRKTGRDFGRRYVQLIAAVLYNCHITGFATGRIYRGSFKGICAPGLNCYSCPGAVFACPLGALQGALAGSARRIPYYVLGTFLLFGVLLGDPGGGGEMHRLSGMRPCLPDGCPAGGGS